MHLGRDRSRTRRGADELLRRRESLGSGAVHSLHPRFALATLGALGKTHDVRWLAVAAIAIAVILLALAPLRLNGYFINLIYITMVYVGLAYGWNIISGYAGYFSFA